MPTTQFARSASEQGEADLRSLSQSLMFLSLAAAQPAAAQMVSTSSHSAQSSANFIRSLGVVSHIDSGSAQWTNAPSLLNQLSYLGIANLRDGAPFDYALPTFVTLARAGIRFNILEANVYSFDQTGQVNAALDVTRAHQLEAAVPGSVISFEGTNEYTTNSYWLNGANSSGNLGWGLADAEALEAAVRADPLFANTPIIAPSAIQLDSLPNFSNFANASNVHIYGGPGEQLQYLIENSVNFARASVPGGPVYITETGISSAGYAAGNWSVTDEPTQALINVNALLDGFSAGATMTFLYELMDEPDPWKSLPEQYFGLFRADGTPKPAATAIHNLTTILADPGTGAVPAGTLDYTVNWLPWSASTLLLQKSDGTFDLVVWNGRAPVYENGHSVTPPESTVNVTLGYSASSIQLFDPIAGTGPISSLQNAASVTFQLSANPIIIEMKFGNAAAPISPSASNVLPGANGSSIITGMADPFSKVSVYEGSNLVGAAAAGGSGAWSLSFVPSALDQHKLTLSEQTVSGQTIAGAGVTLFGKPGQSLFGGTGDDVLIGGAGGRIAGREGSDRFVINPLGDKISVGSFQPGIDRIYIDHRLATDFADLMSHAKQSWGNVQVKFDASNILVLEQTTLGALKAGDFFFI